jgi:hypothetical protein
VEGSDPAASPLGSFLLALFGRDREGFIEIAHRARHGDRSGAMRRGASGGVFVPIHALSEAAAEIERIGRNDDVWVGVLPRQPDGKTGEIGGSREFVHEGRTLWVDCDLKDRPDARELLATFRPAPHLVVASGGGFHAYWLLDEPLAADWVPIANRRLAFALGGDLAATDATRILRPPGTRNLKYQPPRLVELIEL